MTADEACPADDCPRWRRCRVRFAGLLGNSRLLGHSRLRDLRLLGRGQSWGRPGAVRRSVYYVRARYNSRLAPFQIVLTGMIVTIARIDAHGKNPFRDAFFSTSSPGSTGPPCTCRKPARG